MRKISIVISLALLTSAIELSPANAAAPKVGSTCSKVGAYFDTPNKRFVCKKEGKKKLWRVWSTPATANPAATPTASATPTPTKIATPAPIVIPAQQKMTLSSLVNLAQSAIANSDNALPTYEPGNKIKILNISKNNLENFLVAASPSNFTFLGPTPLAESDSNRNGAISLLTADRRSVYGSQNALPPWSVGFKFTTKDSQGRFTVVTSGLGDPAQRYSWRLAYKDGSGLWKYQSITGVSHSNNNQKNFDEVSLGAPGDYSIRLEFMSLTTFYGLGLSESLNSVKPLLSSAPLRVAILGDSWVAPTFEETGPVHDWDAYPGALSWLSGWNVISAGVRGQGYLQPAGNETYKDRIIRDLIPQHPSVIIFTGSSNDHLFLDQQIADELGRDIQALQKADPNVVIIICSPYENGGDQKAPGQSAAMKQVAKTLGVAYIDFVNLPLFDQNNNGQRQLSAGHPTRLGSGYIAQQMLKSLAALQKNGA